MPRIKPGPETEIIGAAMLAAANNLKQGETRTILEKYRFIDIQPDQWYSLPDWIEALDAFMQFPNYQENMVAIGLKVAQYAISPDNLQNPTLGEWSMGWNDHFQANHRGGDIGEIVSEKVAERHYRTIHRHIHQDALMYGVAYGFARTLLPKGVRFEVRYEDPTFRLDYGGGTETVIVIKW